MSWQSGNPRRAGKTRPTVKELALRTRAELRCAGVEFLKGATAATPRLGTTARTSMDLPQTRHSVLLGALRAGLATFLFWAAAHPGVCLARPSDPCEEGREQFARREWRAAQERLWRCVAAGTQTKERAYELVLTYRELKNYEDGFKQLRATAGTTVDVLYLQAFLLFRIGSHRQSIDVLGEAYRLDPGDWRVHQLFALNYVVMEIPEGAQQEFRAAVQLNPRNPELWYQLARLFYSQNRFSESLLASEKALSLSPGYADVHNNLALCYEALAQAEKAREHYEKAIELNQKTGRKDEWPLLNYAAFLMKDEQIESGLALAERALDVNPESGRAYYLRGKALRKLDRLEEAREALARSIALEPNEAGTYYEFGILLRKMGDTAGSRRMFEKFQALRKPAALVLY